MNDSELKNGSENNGIYHATTNLNTAIENPEVNIASAIDMNISNVDNVNSVNVDNSFIDNEVNELVRSSGYDKTFLNDEVDLNKSIEVDTDSRFIVGSDKHSGDSVGSIADKDNEYVVSSESYQPTFKEKKKQKLSFKGFSEFKVMLFIVFILFIFILIIPYIYDFFRGLQLAITNR